MRALLCTIGNRDLTLDGKTAAEVPSYRRQNDAGRDAGADVRQFGADVFKQHAQFKDRLAAPIIDRALDFLSGVSQVPDSVILLVSNQDETSSYRHTDTCEVGRVLSKYIKDRHGIKNVRMREVRDNPSNPDVVLETVVRELSSLTNEFNLLDLVITGGTPAMTTGLLLGALEVSPEKVRPLYVPPTGVVRVLHVAERVRAVQQLRNVLEVMGQGRFAAARQLLDAASNDLGLRNSARVLIRDILNSADARLSFRLDDSRACLGEALSRPNAGIPDSILDRIDELQRSIPASSTTAENGEPRLFAELYFNARYRMQHGEYADFLVRLINFQQGMMLHALRAHEIPFNDRGDQVRSAWLDQHPDFCDLARSESLEPKRATGPVLLLLTKYLSDKSPDLVRVYQSANSLQPLAELRNKSVHGFAPLGKANIEDAWSQGIEELWKVMEDLYSAATGLSFGPDPFAVTRELGAALLKMHT